MKIRRLKLVNFSNIWTGMNKMNIDIDFTKCKNNILLIVGKNGSGKTSLLSNMHPFPYIGTLDIRSSQELILDGKEGLKIFEFEDGDNTYIAEHHYQIKNGKRKTLCFFKKNGIECNPSGLVKSFYDFLNIEFKLNPNFLKIIRLGPNVSDIVSMKSSERKEFMSEFLEEISEYSKLYQIANDESKAIKSQLRIITDQDNMISDIDSLKTDFNILKEKVGNIKKSIQDTYKELYQYQGQMKSVNLDKDETNKIITNYTILMNEYKILSAIFNDTAMTNFVEHAKEIHQLLDSVTKEFDEHKAYLSKLVNENNIINTKIAALQNNIIDTKNSIKLMDSQVALDGYKAQRESMCEDIAAVTYTKDLPTTHFGNATKEKLINLYNGISEIEDILNKLRDCGSDAFRTAIQICQNKKIEKLPKILNQYCTGTLKTLSEQIALQEKMNNLKANNNLTVLYIPNGCKHYQECPFVKHYMKSQKDGKETKTNSSLSALNAKFDDALALQTFGNYFGILVEKIKYLNDYFKSLKMESFKEFNYFDEFFTRFVNGIPNAIAYQSRLADRVHRVIGEIEDSEKYKTLIKAMIDLDILINNYQNNINEGNAKLSLLNDELKKLQNELSDNNKLINAAKIEDEENEKALASYTSTAKIVDKSMQYFVNEDYAKDVIKKYNNITKLLSIQKEYDAKCNEYKEKINTLNNSKKEYIDKMNDLIYKMRRKEELSIAKEGIESKFAYVELIKQSLSSTKGIPLIFIELYFKNIQIIANQILHSMFDDSISLCDFRISEKEFSIPYMNNGIEISDVAFASQGERATIILALSFALLQLFTSKYNIILLDEMDGPLYKDNKEKFVRIVEEQMKAIGCEQCIMITHNNLFENYPVDIIFTSHFDGNDYNNSNIIWKV